jgi:hypothetical protein
MSSEAQSSFELQQTWCAMLQMVPMMSQEKANTLVANKAYSCPKRMYETFLSGAKAEEEHKLGESTESSVLSTLETSFGKLKNGQMRRETKLARLVFKSMIVTDPDAPLVE